MSHYHVCTSVEKVELCFLVFLLQLILFFILLPMLCSPLPPFLVLLLLLPSPLHFSVKRRELHLAKHLGDQGA